MTFDANPFSLWDSLKLADNAFDRVTLVDIIIDPPFHGGNALVRERDGTVTELPWGEQ